MTVFCNFEAANNEIRLLKSKYSVWAVTTFIPKGNIKGIIQFAHGMVEHQVYYYDIMEYFCDKGYLCIINDDL